MPFARTPRRLALAASLALLPQPSAFAAPSPPDHPAGRMAAQDTDHPSGDTVAQDTDRPADRAAIRVVIQRYEDAWNAHDPRSFSQIFAPDGEFTNVRGVDSFGPAGIEKAHAPLFKGMFAHSHQQTTRVRIRFLSPDIAAVDVRWRMTGALDRLGRPRPPATGIRDIIMTKRSGVWRIAIFHNMELPAAEAPSPQPASKDR
jgi:uncharacterized protein (TIGR02246 family)